MNVSQELRDLMLSQTLCWMTFGQTFLSSVRITNAIF